MLKDVNWEFYSLIPKWSYHQTLTPSHLSPSIIKPFSNKLKCLNFDAKTYNFIDISLQNNQIFFI